MRVLGSRREGKRGIKDILDDPNHKLRVLLPNTGNATLTIRTNPASMYVLKWTGKGRL